MSTLPTDAKQRKNIPLFSGLIKYFPDALTAVAELSRIGNDQHNPGKPLHWDRSKSQDELDALTRHLFEAGTIDTDTVRHSTKVAWRALANLQKEIEEDRKNGIQPVDADGWIHCEGKDPELPYKRVIEVEFRNGTRRKDKAGYFDFDIMDNGFDIMKWRSA